jgi:hypothetical protein
MKDLEVIDKRNIVFDENYRRPRKVIRINIATGERQEYGSAYWAAESIVTTSTEIRVTCNRNEGLKKPQFQRKGYYFIWGD